MLRGVEIIGSFRTFGGYTAMLLLMLDDITRWAGKSGKTRKNFNTSSRLSKGVSRRSKEEIDTGCEAVFVMDIWPDGRVGCLAKKRGKLRIGRVALRIRDVVLLRP